MTGTVASAAIQRAPWRYGLLGAPLAFLALPLYIHLPNMYAREFGVPLATLGILLLAARLLDALVDPAIGVAVDRILRHSARRALDVGALAALVIALGFAGLFMPVVREPGPLLAWAAALLAVTYAGYSVLSVLHQAWAAMHGGGTAVQSALVGWREGLALGGVLAASVLAATAPAAVLAATLAVLLAAGCAAWRTADRPSPTTSHTALAAAPSSWCQPFADARFIRLFAVFLLNGVANAIPATLVLFFVQDALQAPRVMEAAALGTYFIAAAVAVPAWVSAMRRFGLARCWLAGIALAMVVFVFASSLRSGDTAAFLAVCALSGAALGADLVAPAALLAATIERAGARGRAEGVYFGWWNFAAKLSLALAAGLALPLLALAGYSPGSRGESALGALAFAYCVLPCALKAAAGATLYFHFMRKESSP